MSESAKNLSDNPANTTGLEHIFVQEKVSEKSEDEIIESENSSQSNGMNNSEEIKVEYSSDNTIDDTTGKSDLTVENVEDVEVDENSTEQNDSSEQVNIQYDVDATIQVSMAEASRRLDMPYPTLRRHVLAGKIKSTIGEDGKRLVILDPDEHSNEQDNNQNEQLENSSSTSNDSESVQLLIDELRDSHEYSRKMTEKMIELQGQNGYLQGRLESKQEEVKLLTDRSIPSEIEYKAKAIEQENEQLKVQLEQLRKEIDSEKLSAWTKMWSWLFGIKK